MEDCSAPSIKHLSDSVCSDALPTTADPERPLTDDQRGGLLTLSGYLLVLISLLSDYAIGMPGGMFLVLLLLLFLCIGGSFLGSKIPFVILTGATLLMTCLAVSAVNRLTNLLNMESLLILGLPIAACIMFWMPSVRAFLKNRAREAAEFSRTHRKDLSPDPGN